jgi:replicative DNA helicase
LSDGRPLPRSPEAEAAVLGALLLDNAHYQAAAGCIAAADFSLDSHRRIFARIGDLLGRERAADIVTLSEELRRTGEIAAVGGVAYLCSLTEGLPRRVSIGEYLRIVKEKSLLRQTISAADRVAASAAEQINAPEVVLAQAEAVFHGIAGQAATTGLESVAAFLQEAYPRIDSIFERSARQAGIASGFAALDALTAGFQPREMAIIGARPSIGKTALACNIAAHAALAGKTVAFFSLEMPKRALIDRICCARSRVSLEDHRHGRLTPCQKGYFLQSLGDLAAAPLYIDDQPEQTPLVVEAKAARLKSQAGLDLILIDYLGLVRPETRRNYENREQAIAGVSRAIKAMAKRLEAPVVLLAQLNRELHKRADKRPILSDLRESGAIEQDADLVLFLHREEYYNRDDPSLAGQGEIIVAKARNGPLGTVHLHYDAQTCRFSNPGE